MNERFEIQRGDTPLVIAIHSGTDIPADIEGKFVSPWLARKDSDWWIDLLYGFAVKMGATMARTRISRSIIDVNRDPSGASLYPGQATTELCPTTSLAGELLYSSLVPNTEEIARRRELYVNPYHTALTAELDRLRALHGRVVLYDAHSIVSRIPRLFEGELPHFNIGTIPAQPAIPCLRRPWSQLLRRPGGTMSSTVASAVDGPHVITAGPPMVTTLFRSNWQYAGI